MNIRMTGAMLFFSVSFALTARDVPGAVIYRIGMPFSEAEKDSLEGIGIGFVEIDWSASELQEALELDSLETGVLQPNFFEVDEDIAATVVDRGGYIAITTTYNFWEKNISGMVLIDQDSTTGWEWAALAADTFESSQTVGGTAQAKSGVTLMLGGRFLVREVRVRPLAERPEHFLERFRFGISDPNFDQFRVPWFPDFIEVKENTEPEIIIIIDPPVTTEAVQLEIIRSTPKEIGIADFEVYGGGYVGKAAYESEVIALDDIASLGEIRWEGRRDFLARVDIRTRSGSDPQPEFFWESRAEQQDSVKFLGGGRDLSFREYKSQYGRFADYRKPVDPNDRSTPDTENWSFWSSPYTFETPGVQVVSPSPRRYFQLRADFASTTDNGGKIDYVQFKASIPPSVHRLVGEIHPIETSVGEPTRFTYYVRPTIREGDFSFDGVEIFTPSGVLSVDSLRIAGVNQSDFSWDVNADGLGFEVKFPRKLTITDSGALVEVVYVAPVLREVGTEFLGRVFDSASPYEVRQQIAAGNASDDVVGDRLSVRTSLSSSLVFAPTVGPNPFTPNGDGINDIVRLSYKLLRVTSAVPVSIALFDLSGRIVREVYAGEVELGEYDQTWDGKDRFGNLVPPGLYLYRIEADVQSERETVSGILSVAY